MALRMKGGRAPTARRRGRRSGARAQPRHGGAGPGARRDDTCGTGGDGAGLVNVSTLAAVLAAAGGRPGRRSAAAALSSQAGSADVLGRAGRGGRRRRRRRRLPARGRRSRAGAPVFHAADPPRFRAPARRRATLDLPLARSRCRPDPRRPPGGRRRRRSALAVPVGAGGAWPARGAPRLRRPRRRWAGRRRRDRGARRPGSPSGTARSCARCEATPAWLGLTPAEPGELAGGAAAPRRRRRAARVFAGRRGCRPPAAPTARCATRRARPRDLALVATGRRRAQSRARGAGGGDHRRRPPRWPRSSELARRAPPPSATPRRRRSGRRRAVERERGHGGRSTRLRHGSGRATGRSSTEAAPARSPRPATPARVEAAPRAPPPARRCGHRPALSLMGMLPAAPLPSGGPTAGTRRPRPASRIGASARARADPVAVAARPPARCPMPRRSRGSPTAATFVRRRQTALPRAARRRAKGPCRSRTRFLVGATRSSNHAHAAAPTHRCSSSGIPRRRLACRGGRGARGRLRTAWTTCPGRGPDELPRACPGAAGAHVGVNHRDQRPRRAAAAAPGG
ncbi:MAG: hypothetical protein HS111_23760 [Kofleriaceae bacterium]|nr:hypothetical protein [Kofleriaceae bacterium]